jgi:hypothetical protein
MLLEIVTDAGRMSKIPPAVAAVFPVTVLFNNDNELELLGKIAPPSLAALPVKVLLLITAGAAEKIAPPDSAELPEKVHPLTVKLPDPP